MSVSSGGLPALRWRTDGAHRLGAARSLRGRRPAAINHWAPDAPRIRLRSAVCARASRVQERPRTARGAAKPMGFEDRHALIPLEVMRDKASSAVRCVASGAPAAAWCRSLSCRTRRWARMNGSSGRVERRGQWSATARSSSVPITTAALGCKKRCACPARKPASAFGRRPRLATANQPLRLEPAGPRCWRGSRWLP